MKRKKLISFFIVIVSIIAYTVAVITSNMLLLRIVSFLLAVNSVYLLIKK